MLIAAIVISLFASLNHAASSSKKRAAWPDIDINASPPREMQEIALEPERHAWHFEESLREGPRQDHASNMNHLPSTYYDFFPVDANRGAERDHRVVRENSATASSDPSPNEDQNLPQPSRKIQRSRSRRDKDELVEVKWCENKIPIGVRDQIYARLRSHWNGLEQPTLFKRMMKYVINTGKKITSLGPLIESNQANFEKAAELIYYTKDGEHKKAQRNPAAGPNDILHQPIGTNAELKWPTDERYNTPHTWYQNMTPGKMDYFHNMVAAHWSNRLENPYFRQTLLLRLNEYFEHHPKSLELIKAGRDDEAWKVARDVCGNSTYMKYPCQYPYGVSSNRLW